MKKRTFTFKNPPNADVKVEIRETESGLYSIWIQDTDSLVGRISMNRDEIWVDWR